VKKNGLYSYIAILYFTDDILLFDTIVTIQIIIIIIRQYSTFVNACITQLLPKYAKGSDNIYFFLFFCNLSNFVLTY